MPIKIALALVVTVVSVWYCQRRISQIPQASIKHTLRILLLALSIWVGSSYGFSEAKVTYTDEDMNETTRGYPFVLSRIARYSDGYSEDYVSIFPAGIRAMNFCYGVLIVNFWAMLALYLIEADKLTVAYMRDYLKNLQKKPAGDTDSALPPGEPEADSSAETPSEVGSTGGAISSVDGPPPEPPPTSRTDTVRRSG